MYKTEPHLHVSQVSRCAKLSASEMVSEYAAACYSTLFVTDHLCPKFIDSLGDIPWDMKVTVFMSGYYYAKEAGRASDLTVLLGAEVSLKGEPNHYLLYGFDREFLLNNPDVCYITPAELSRRCREAGILIIQAHPYRDGRNYPTPALVDAIEAINTNPRHDDGNAAAAELAATNGLPITGGSDAHRQEDVARGGVMTEERILTVKDYIDAVLQGRVRPIGEEL